MTPGWTTYNHIHTDSLLYKCFIGSQRSLTHTGLLIQPLRILTIVINKYLINKLSQNEITYESQKGFASAMPAEVSSTPQISMYQTDWKKKTTRLTRLKYSKRKEDSHYVFTYWWRYPFCTGFELRRSNWINTWYPDSNFTSLLFCKLQRKYLGNRKLTIMLFSHIPWSFWSFTTTILNNLITYSYMAGNPTWCVKITG